MIQIFIQSNSGDMIDISSYIQDVTWSGKKSSAGREVNVSFLDDWKSFKGLNIDIMQGYDCIVYWKQLEIFRGKILKIDTDLLKGSFVAKDSLFYLCQNEDSFSYENKTANEILNDLCYKYELRNGNEVDTEYRISSIVENNKKASDVLFNALSQTYKNTGARYYPISEKGEIKIIRRADRINAYIIESGINLISYSSSTDITDIATRVLIKNDEGSTIITEENKDLQNQLGIGILQKVVRPDSELNEAQQREFAQTQLGILSKPKKTVNINALGEVEAISGSVIYLYIEERNISQGYYIDSDSHSFKDGIHTMSLTLTETEEKEE